MATFAQYQAIATKVPVSLRNNRDRIDFPVRGLQEEAGKLGTLLATTFVSGKFALTEAQEEEVKDRLSDVLWYVGLLCGETGISMEEVAGHSLAQLRARIKGLDPERR